MTYRLDEIKILIVEDMLPMLTLTKSLLQIFGFKEIIGARSGPEAFELYCKENPDIIITDWIMEPMSGLEFINKIRKDPKSPNPFVPIILMTGYSSRKHVELARDNGMTEFLVKPYTARDLYNKVAQLIEKPRQFVSCEQYFGPDRRRKEDSYQGPIRRKLDYYEAKQKEANADDDIIMRNKEIKQNTKSKKSGKKTTKAK